MSSITQRVATGAAQLDVMVPNWETKINLETLVISDGSRCILAQLFGHYGQGKRELRINGYEAGQLGFNAMGSFIDVFQYRKLTKEWKRIIQARLDAQFEAQKNQKHVLIAA